MILRNLATVLSSESFWLVVAWLVVATGAWFGLRSIPAIRTAPSWWRISASVVLILLLTTICLEAGSSTASEVVERHPFLFGVITNGLVLAISVLLVERVLEYRSTSAWQRVQAHAHESVRMAASSVVVKVLEEVRRGLAVNLCPRSDKTDELARLVHGGPDADLGRLPAHQVTEILGQRTPFGEEMRFDESDRAYLRRCLSRLLESGTWRHSFGTCVKGEISSLDSAVANWSSMAFVSEEFASDLDALVAVRARATDLLHWLSSTDGSAPSTGRLIGCTALLEALIDEAFKLRRSIDSKRRANARSPEFPALVGLSESEFENVLNREEQNAAGIGWSLVAYRTARIRGDT